MDESDTVTPVQPPFRANSLHDLESLWWILMWVLHYHVDERMPVLSPEQETQYRKHFPGLGQTRLPSLTDVVQVKSLPETFCPIASMANKMRTILQQSYRQVEHYSGVTVDNPYQDCSKFFLWALQQALNPKGQPRLDVRLVPMDDVKKRKVALELVEEKVGT
jgi:hypothetical protein